eukprot:TRINITY_DN8029_c0_g3_i1.p1 TRINITY_DN8029_c0_g3~~TRINITY_DN8029_c0_g3_i1.p1  ORF type:complete len:322 (-),score=81.09 TRINITY_DN8029_c0_g3_i1:88-1053(-)
MCIRDSFRGEQGIDEGGVRKEFFQLITRELFDSKWGMFIPKNNEQYLWFNPHSFECTVNFELIGMVLGLAIYNSILLELNLPIVVYKKLLGQQTSLADLREIDPVLHNSLEKLLEFEGDIENSLCLTFSVEEEVYGAIQSFELIPGGRETAVTQENKVSYVKSYVDWYLNKSIEKQFTPFLKGFYKVVTGNIIKIFTPRELNVLICGSQKLDFNELERAMEYEDGFDKDSQVIKDLWAILHSFNEEQKKKFLFFCTGTDRAPIQGLGSLRFIVSRWGPDSDKLPTAHTCFNHLLLPEYSSREKLREKLLTAMNYSEGFGLF